MFGIGFQELVVIFLVIMIFVGPRRIPEFARFLVKLVKDFVRAREQIKERVQRELGLYDDLISSEDRHGRAKHGY